MSLTLSTFKILQQCKYYLQPRALLSEACSTLKIALSRPHLLQRVYLLLQLVFLFTCFNHLVSQLLLRQLGLLEGGGAHNGGKVIL